MDANFVRTVVDAWDVDIHAAAQILVAQIATLNSGLDAEIREERIEQLVEIAKAVQR